VPVEYSPQAKANLSPRTRASLLVAKLEVRGELGAAGARGRPRIRAMRAAVGCSARRAAVLIGGFLLFGLLATSRASSQRHRRAGGRVPLHGRAASVRQFMGPAASIVGFRRCYEAHGSELRPTFEKGPRDPVHAIHDSAIGPRDVRIGDVDLAGFMLQPSVGCCHCEIRRQVQSSLGLIVRLGW
jgi:hypothetical protein